MPPQGTMQNNSQDSGNNKIIVLALVFVLLLVGVFYFLSKRKAPAPTENAGVTETNQNSGYTQEKVEIKKTSLMTGNETNKLPKGFPTDLPVDTTSVTESYVAEYPNRNLTQYTLAFLTTKSVKDEVNMYVSAIEKAGYTFTADGKDLTHGYLNATKGKMTVSVVVGTSNSKTTVNITYSVEK